MKYFFMLLCHYVIIKYFLENSVVVNLLMMLKISDELIFQNILVVTCTITQSQNRN